MHPSLRSHMIAARDIRPGEVILRERPLTFGPSDHTRPLCLGCYKTIESFDESLACRDCGFPMCSLECQTVPEHRDFECQAMKKNGYRVNAAKFKYNGCRKDRMDFYD